jgi:adenylate cyclase
MGERKNLCVLVVEIVGGPSLDASASGALEVKHAIDRCLRRIDLAIEANKGVSLRRNQHGIGATFERCDAAILAACEMLERTQSLPPLRGKRFSVRVGLHYGTVDPDVTIAGEGEEIARRLADAARTGEALATAAVVMQLSSNLRHFARPETTQNDAIADLEWPLYAVSRQPESVVSLPPATRLLQRLRIRHQEDVLFVDELRPIVLFNREFNNDIVIMDPRASRQHARIERRRGGFMLIDYSTNGCYLVEDEGTERCVKGHEVSLVGPGRIGCGFSAGEVERDLVFFDIV